MGAITRYGVIVGLLILLLVVHDLDSPFASLAMAAPNVQVTVVSPLQIMTPTPTSSTRFALPTVTPTPTSSGDHVRLDVKPGDGIGNGSGTYMIQPGDTLLTVSLEIGVDVGDMPCLIAPDFDPEQPLVIGDVFAIPATEFVCRQVHSGETLASIAEQYGVVPVAIRQITWNRLQGVPSDEVLLVADSYLRIPAVGTVGNGEEGFLAFLLNQPVEVSPYVVYSVGGPRASTTTSVVPENWPFGSGNFSWPVYGWMSQGYRNDHRAIDIAAPIGTLVTAADRGVVIRAGWNNQGYGQFVIVDHNIDYITLYAHLGEVYVQEGDVVAPGEVLGAVGSSGNSTGPHLHFELRDFGRRANPLQYLAR